MLMTNEFYRVDIEHFFEKNLELWKLKEKSVLVIGATGMIGSVLVDLLYECNQRLGLSIRIGVVGRNRGKAEARFKKLVGSGIVFYEADINKCLAVEEGYDYVFHCASNTHPRAYATDPIGTVLTNVVGTNNVLEYCVKKKSKRMIFLSSVEIYGENRGDTQKFAEDYCGYIDCNTLRAGYPEGKRAGEALCQAYIEEYNLDVVIPRICRVYGPTMQESDSKALAQFIKKAAAGENIVLKSDGKQLYSYCYVADVATALIYLLLYGKKGNAYNVSDAESDITLGELAQILADYAGSKVVYELPDATEAKGYSTATVACLDNSRLLELGWSADTGIRDGLKKTVLGMKGVME